MSMPPSYAMVLLLMVVGTAFIFFFCVMLIYQLFISEKNILIAEESYKNMKKAYNFYRYTSVSCFTFCLLTACIDMVHGYLSYANNHAMLLNYYTIIKGSADVTYFAASLHLNLLIFGRCYFTFKYSVFALSKWTIAFISIQIIFSMQLSIGYCILLFVFGDNEQIDDIYAAPLIIGIFVTDLTISVSMLLLFIYKLHQLIASISNTHNTPQQNNDNSQYKSMQSELNYTDFFPSLQNEETSVYKGSINSVFDPNESQASQQSTFLTNLLPKVHLDTHQLGLLEIITKNTILSTLAIFFNQMWYSLDYISMTPSLESSIWFGLFIYGMRMIGMIGIVLSIYLSMKFSQTIYFHCCQCCHFNCYKCCMNWSRQTMNNKTKK
eukprot:518053_1